MSDTTTIDQHDVDAAGGAKAAVAQGRDDPGSPDPGADLTQLEDIKAGSDYLSGAILDEVAAAVDEFSEDARQVLKFHGIYAQDDRDVRRKRLGAGLGKDHSCMVRASIPGGVLTADQYLAADRLADVVASGSLRITTRQGLQWHFVKHDDLSTLLRTLNEHLVTTLAACGDVARNTMACPAPLPGRDDPRLQDHAQRLARVLRPRSQTYWKLWLDGDVVTSALSPEPVGDLDGPEPLYGRAYLPRKFKVGLAPPGDNCIDVYSQDVGVVPVHTNGEVTRYTILVGGGLGMSHNNDATYPRLASPLGTVAADELVDVVTAIVAVQRDHGDRTDRKHARLKYLVDDWGLDAIRAAVGERLGHVLAPAGDLDWDDTDDHLGWHRQHDDRWFRGVHVRAGRIADVGSKRLRTSLRTIVEEFEPEVRFTPRQDVLLCDLDEDDRDAVDALLAGYDIGDPDDLLPLERTALACPALPTCGLALTEAERVLPQVTDDLLGELAEVGLDQESVHVRLTGCPNGCSRPYSTEVGIVGRGKDTYTVFLGGDAAGTRLGRTYADRIARDDLSRLLAPVVTAWANERDEGEGLGDWTDRVGIDALRERFEVAEQWETRRRRRRG